MVMEAKEIFEALSKNVREMLSDRGLGLYIPPYQRPYGWDKEKVNKLIDDILHGYYALLGSDDSFTFLGTVITIHDINFTTVQPIVRPEVPGKVLTVIDGQQRLTTLLSFCIAIHNHIRLARTRLLKDKKPENMSSVESWLDGQTLRLIDDLASTFYERQASGDSPRYPRMIRSFDDQWSRTKTNAKYDSPIANLIFTYTSTIDEPKPIEFKPQKRDGHIEGEAALIDRYTQISKVLKSIVNVRNKSELPEELPTLKQIANNAKFQHALLNHDFPEEVSDIIRRDDVTVEFQGLLHLALLASYLLNRVAVTVVRGKNEDYAFTIFESLNTTGEPLTAFETFKPRVVSAEGLSKFEKSEARVHIDNISGYLSKFQVGEALQAATRDLLIFFAAAETGFKLSKRLADQRRYLKEEFERYEKNEIYRVDFVRHLQNTAIFKEHAWDANGGVPSLHNLPVDATTDAVKLCLAFLSDLKHSVTIAPLVRFYSVALAADDASKPYKIKELEEALKAMTAFSVLWRASHRGTANIDKEYREILAGVNTVTGLAPLARALKKDVSDGAIAPAVDVAKLKAELRGRLADPDHGAIADKESFLVEANLLPAYTNAQVTRFVLLGAYHNAVADTDCPGLIKKGKAAVASCLTHEGWLADAHLSLEHIAPQQNTSGWDESIYESRETVHRIGNLVLLKKEANSSLADRPWPQKRVLYQALGANSSEAAANILEDAKLVGIDFSNSTGTITELSGHMPHLIAIGQKPNEWTLDFIDARTKRILGLAWDELYKWLE